MSNSMKAVGNAVRESVSYLETHPEEGRTTDSLARAEIVEGLRCRAVAPDGAEIFSDMPAPVGGAGSAPSPGWLMRAALATCDATIIAMRAAELGIELTTLEVEVDSESDDRGFLGVDETVPGGPLKVRTRIRIGASNVEADRLQQIVEWCDRRSPVADAIRRAVESSVEAQIVT